jgi:hypothetical protein
MWRLYRYKLSLSLQNPAHRDRSAQASRIDLRHFEFYDIHHVCDKFKLTPDSNLAQRLGRANTKRRQLLAYYKDHSDKISKYIDVTLTKAVPAPQLPMKIEIQSEYQQKPPTISTQWTQDTTVSTIYQNIEVASDSGRTKFSAATSTMGDQDKIEIVVPPPPSASSVTRRDPFICPYCHQTVQVENDEDWTYHVYSDLRPYICTFGGCVKENQLYDSFTEWSAHERQFHRREWFCTLCRYTSGRKSSFIKHLDDHHTNISNEQRQEMENQSKSSTLAQQCPLCTKPPMSNSGRFQQHLARHLQQLALFALPRGEADDEDSAAREQESNESQKALVMDVEDRESINSIPIDDEASMAEGSTSGLLSPTDDRLLDAIPREMINDTSEDVESIAESMSSGPSWVSFSENLVVFHGHYFSADLPNPIPRDILRNTFEYVGEESEDTSTVDSKRSTPNISPRREAFPEEPNPIRENVASLEDANKSGIPPSARWTKINRILVNPAALEAGNERYEERALFVIVLRILTEEEIQAYALKTREIRGKLFQFETVTRGFNSTDNSLDLFLDARHEEFVRDKRQHREEKERQANDQDSAAREEGSNESQQASVMGEEERESLHSISIDDEASMAESSISGLLSPIDDRLMNAIPQETIKHTSGDEGSEADYSIYRSDSAVWDRPSPTLTFPTYSSNYLQMMNDTSEDIGDESEGTFTVVSKQSPHMLSCEEKLMTKIQQLGRKGRTSHNKLP